MMLHKIFHMNQSLEETKRRLANVSSYRHHLDGVQQADFSGEGTSSWKLLLPLGFRADFTMDEVNTDENTVVFKSKNGDFKIMGVLTFHSIKKNLTEIDFVVNYESTSFLFNALDRMLNVGDHYLVNQLRRVRAHFEGIAAPMRGTSEVYHGQLKPVAA